MRELEVDGTVFLAPDAPGIIFTTRVGGFSQAPFEGLNLGFATGDDMDLVRRNREKVASALGIGAAWVTGHQVHGALVLQATPKHAGGPPPRPKGDAIVTQSAGLPIAVLAADCVPIALTNVDRIAAVHAGWRGICAGVIEAAAVASGPGTRAHLGPSIGPCHYQVGPDLPEAFGKAYPDAPRFTSENGEGMTFDLRAACMWVLSKNGIDVDDDIYSIPCTVCDRRFYSYRRDGATGRHALIMWR